jgi:hypothetical protein
MTTRPLALSAALFGVLSLGTVACDDKGDDTGTEDCGNASDDDGDGDVDCADSDCDGDDACQDESICDDGIDNDGDEDIDCEDRDCNSDDTCTETGDECGDEEDNDGDGDTDCEDSDCECFTPTNFGMGFNVGVQAGEFITPTYNGGTALDNLAALYLIDYNNYSGLDDESYTCHLYYSLDTAEELDVSATDFSGDTWAFGWTLATSDLVQTYGNCENLNASEFGTEDASEFAGAYTWSVVFTSNITSDMRTTLEGTFTDYADIEDNLVGAYFGTDYGGSSVAYDEYDYGLVYAIDETGELVTDGSTYTFVDMSEATYPLDGFYSGSAYWLPQL